MRGLNFHPACPLLHLCFCLCGNLYIYIYIYIYICRRRDFGVRFLCRVFSGFGVVFLVSKFMADSICWRGRVVSGANVLLRVVLGVDTRVPTSARPFAMSLWNSGSKATGRHLGPPVLGTSFFGPRPAGARYFFLNNQQVHCICTARSEMQPGHA